MPPERLLRDKERHVADFAGSQLRGERRLQRAPRPGAPTLAQQLKDFLLRPLELARPKAGRPFRDSLENAAVIFGFPLIGGLILANGSLWRGAIGATGIWLVGCTINAVNNPTRA